MQKTDSRVTKKITRLSVFYALRRRISESIILIKKQRQLLISIKRIIYICAKQRIYTAPAAKYSRKFDISRSPVAIFADTITMQKNNVPMK